MHGTRQHLSLGGWQKPHHDHPLRACGRTRDRNIPYLRAGSKFALPREAQEARVVPISPMVEASVPSVDSDRAPGMVGEEESDETSTGELDHLWTVDASPHDSDECVEEGEVEAFIGAYLERRESKIWIALGAESDEEDELDRKQRSLLAHGYDTEEERAEDEEWENGPANVYEDEEDEVDDDVAPPPVAANRPSRNDALKVEAEIMEHKLSLLPNIPF